MKTILLIVIIIVVGAFAVISVFMKKGGYEYENPCDYCGYDDCRGNYERCERYKQYKHLNHK